MLKHKIISEPVYGSRFMIVFGKIKALNNWCKKRFKGRNIAFEPFTGAKTIIHDGQLFLVLPDTHIRNIPMLSSIVAHECVHLVWSETSYRGMKLTRSSQEAFAYLTGFYVEEIMRFLTKKKKNVKIGLKGKS